MIAYLRGLVREIGEDHVVLDVHGVGYLVQCASSTLAALPRIGEAVELSIETQMRDDAITLIGFANAQERAWFKLLVGIQGVGAKVALAILASLRPDALTAAIASKDVASLSRAQGVGKKLATRIASELQEKVGSLPQAAPSPPASSGAQPPASAPAGEAGVFSDAVSALVNLGYARSDAWSAAQQVAAATGDADFSTLVRESLKRLSPT